MSDGTAGRGTDKRKLALCAEVVHTFVGVENLSKHIIFCLEAGSIPGISRISFLHRNLMIFLLSRSCHSICIKQNTVFYIYIYIYLSNYSEREESEK